ncbi:hypothetical protein CEP51_013868 [Fusarium floridanum]|uniref:Uncharacterized protein n=1 Tax=Fusarium floridanum TaxID=1325733 RepID=A0A428Q3D3_9HYPO|nr:hypothetical protein CEP51_013868 [Fusarium floridanum]
MTDKMTKLKKSKRPKDIKESERDEFRPRGEDKEKKEKKKRHSQQSPPSAPPWIWWLAGGPNQRKKRPSHKSTKEKSSSSKKHSTKERSTDKKKTSTSTTKRHKRRERKDESEDDMDDETNSAAGDLGGDDGENVYRMMPSQAKQSYKNNTWIDEQHSSVGSNRTDYSVPEHNRVPDWAYSDTGNTGTNGERELAARHQGVCPQEPRRQDDFQAPAVQHDYRSTSQNNSQANSTNTAHQQPPAPQNDTQTVSTSAAPQQPPAPQNNTGHVDENHGAQPTIQEEPPKPTSCQCNTDHPKQEQNTATTGRDTATNSGDGCGVTNMRGDEQDSNKPAGQQAGENEHTTSKKTEDPQVKEQRKEQATGSNGLQGNQQESKGPASQQAGEDELKAQESTDTASKKAEGHQVKEQLKEQTTVSNSSQANQQELKGSDESRVNENESTESNQLSSCIVT